MLSLFTWLREGRCGGGLHSEHSSPFSFSEPFRVSGTDETLRKKVQAVGPVLSTLLYVTQISVCLGHGVSKEA